MGIYRGILISLFLLCGFIGLEAQDGSWKSEAIAWQEKMDTDYRDTAHSPLTPVQLESFKGLPFFKLRSKYCVRAQWVRTPDEKPFDLPTSSGKTKRFVKYGVLRFKLNGQELEISAYQNLKLARMPQYKDYLFIPFKDHTNGFQSYGGGRYIDFPIPKTELVWLDFNQCYNPYCAYSTGWNCPIPPEENWLPLKIKAGVKMHKDKTHH